ncbi:MAG TPA: MarR family transcriptional regulator [Gemmatimonadaceae bacterium]|nr:MarR family transcriptional regulator [Gemmatimonadaceae bacterium]
MSDTKRTSRPAVTADLNAEPLASHGAADPALQLWVVLARAYTAVARHAEADVARHGLTGSEFGILEALYHKGPMLLGEIQRKVLVSSGGITFLVDRLATRGLVERRACAEDRRARYAALTPDGEALIERIFPEHRARLHAVLAGLSADEQRDAARLLRQLGRAAAELPPGGSTE